MSFKSCYKEQISDHLAGEKTEISHRGRKVGTANERELMRIR